MKPLLICLFMLLAGLAQAQPLIHAHNDYQQARPLTNALRNRVFSLEADVYRTERGLMVAHNIKDTVTAPALAGLYLQPIIRLFRKHHGRISKSKTYAPILMIDSKAAGAAVIAQLVNETAAHPSVFDRSLNPLAVQIVISGDRGNLSQWTYWPSFIQFDGRPYEVYDSATLLRVAFISDAYFKYVTETDSTTRIRQLAEKVHAMGKRLRLWAIPDNPTAWKRLRELGVDIINTDKVGECRDYFMKED
jgi:alkaline phosphatase